MTRLAIPAWMCAAVAIVIAAVVQLRAPVFAGELLLGCQNHPSRSLAAAGHAGP